MSGRRRNAFILTFISLGRKREDRAAFEASQQEDTRTLNSYTGLRCGWERPTSATAPGQLPVVTYRFRSNRLSYRLLLSNFANHFFPGKSVPSRGQGVASNFHREPVVSRPVWNTPEPRRHPVAGPATRPRPDAAAGHPD